MQRTQALQRTLGLMEGFPAPWCVAGGWAVDLFLGKVTREHGDVDIAIFRDDQRAVHDHFRGWQVRKVVRGQLVEWPADKWLERPVHEIHVRAPQGGRSVEFLLNERSGNVWVFRRHPAVTYPASDVMRRGQDGIPFLAPALVLLYKAKSPRPCDERDFEQARGALSRKERRWLKDAIQLVHPGHEWLGRL